MTGRKGENRMARKASFNYTLPTGYELRTMSNKDLESYIKKAGKNAQQALRQLEKDEMQTHSRAYRKMQAMAESQAHGDSVHFWIDYEKKTYNGKRPFKFRTATKGLTREQLITLARKIESFMTGTESTKAKVLKREEQTLRHAYETFMNNHGQFSKDKFTFEDYKKFWSEVARNSYDTIYGSSDVIVVLEDIETGNISEIKEKAPQMYYDLEHKMLEYAERTQIANPFEEWLNENNMSIRTFNSLTFETRAKLYDQYAIDKGLEEL